MDPESLDVVVGIAECVDLEFAAVARAGVDFANGEAAAGVAIDQPPHLDAEGLEVRIAVHRLGNDADAGNLCQYSEHL